MAASRVRKVPGIREIAWQYSCSCGSTSRATGDHAQAEKWRKNHMAAAHRILKPR